ncbi:MAG: BlaI/MecI/CopY family transcriptional regulator [Longimicrobiales bacterium]|nr:BlaI/MecI/CopY family transcriptional regulator [Longimicrobiales bacterium]
MPPTRFSERELDVMAVLWRLESGTVAEVRDALDGNVGYTGILKLLQILEEKGAVRHESEGRAYRYFPLVTPEAAGGPALQRLIDTIFQGSAEMLLARLVSTAEPKPDEVRRMRELLDQIEDPEEER